MSSATAGLLGGTELSTRIQEVRTRLQSARAEGMSRIQQVRTNIQSRTGLKLPGAQIVDGVFSGQVISAGQPILPQVRSRVETTLSRARTVGLLASHPLSGRLLASHPLSGILKPQVTTPPPATPQPANMSTGTESVAQTERFEVLRRDMSQLASTMSGAQTARISI